MYIWSFKKKKEKRRKKKKKRNLKLRICGLNAWWWLNDRINHARAGPLFSLIWIFTSRTDPFRQPIRIFKGRPWLIHLNAGMQEIRRGDSLKICPGARQLSFRFKPANWGPRRRSGADEFFPKNGTKWGKQRVWFVFRKWKIFTCQSTTTTDLCECIYVREF